MKIVLIAKPWRGGLADYLYRALDDLFPGEVAWWPTRPVSLTEKAGFVRNKRQWYERLWERLNASRADVHLFINYPKELPPLPARGNQVLWLTDGPQPRPGELDAFSRVYVTDPGYSDAVSAVVKDSVFGGEVSFGFSPDVHFPVRSNARKQGTCFIGNRDRKRDAYLAGLFESGLQPPLVVGNYFLHHPLFWRHPLCFRPSVSNRGMGKIYAAHLVSLNIHAEIVREGTNMRTFECAAYGIPQLVEYRPGLERFFEPGLDLAVFSNEEDMLQKLADLNAQPEQAMEMARRARRKALACHSYHHRVLQLLDGFFSVAELETRLPKVLSVDT